MVDPRALGVYVVTTASFGAGRDHRAIAAAAIEGGATAVQLRAPELDDESLLTMATGLARVCRDARVLFVVNDRLDVAVESGAAGVHVGQADDPGAVRAHLGPGRVLGVSVGDEHEAAAAERAGADYLGVTVWSTPTKPEAEARGLDGLAGVVAATDLPVVGIGGISAGNATQVLEAGAVGIAVISAVAAAHDPTAATRSLVEVVGRFRAGRPGARR